LARLARTYGGSVPQALTKKVFRDYRHVSLVCKRWHAVAQTPAYWLPNIRKALQECFLDQLPHAVVEKFNPFRFPEASLGVKVAWVMRSDWQANARNVTWWDQLNNPDSDANSYENSDANSYENSDENSDGEEELNFCVEVRYRQKRDVYTEIMLKNFDREDEVLELWHNDEYHQIFTNRAWGILQLSGKLNYAIRKPPEWMIFKTDPDCPAAMSRGAQFQGNLVSWTTDEDWEKMMVPHGAGYWTFADGTYFIGDNVAFAGLPHGKGHNQDNFEEEWFAGQRIWPPPDE
jgi:hypothetical protein